MSDMESASVKKVREPLFHLAKRSNFPSVYAWLIRAGAVLLGLVLSALLAFAMLGANPIDFFKYMTDGCFGTERRIWILFKDSALLLGFSVAIVPAFKMKYWNLGADGQVLMGCLATTACMFYLNGKVPLGALIPIMLVASILVSVIWAVIPAIFKAIWKTNETLFTLMMNYIAQGLVTYFVSVWVKTGSGTLNPINSAMVPQIYNAYLLPILLVVLMTAFMYIYMRFGKHGYEISVVGGSENTARYIGINVKKVVIRTLVLTGIICGIMGFILSGCINGTVNKDMTASRGFTAVMVAWLGQFNPLIMVIYAVFIVAIKRGVTQVNTKFGLSTDAFSSIITGLIFFLLIACEFIITYVIKRNKKNKGGIK